MATVKTRKPTGKEVMQYLNKRSNGAYDYPYMLNGYHDGKWYINGFVASKGDWVAVRLLYLVLALDPSNLQIAEVKNAHGFYEDKFGYDGLLYMFQQLAKDPKSQKSFEKNPESKAVREFHKSFKPYEGEVEDITKSV
jgi:hypothetical protein